MLSYIIISKLSRNDGAVTNYFEVYHTRTTVKTKMWYSYEYEYLVSVPGSPKRLGW